MNKHQYEVFADYHQIYVTFDKSSDSIPEWTELERRQNIAFVNNGFIISTVRDMDVKVTVEIHKNRPDLLLMEYDRFHEFDIQIPSSQIFLSGTSDYIGDFKEIELEAGEYGFIVGFSGLNAVSEDGLDGDDSYHINLWSLSKLNN